MSKPEPAQSWVPSTCVLTGAESENPDDCTTHDHETDSAQNPVRPDGGDPAVAGGPCPQGRTDYEACFAPFRYCPVKGCGRAEAATGPCCGNADCTCCQATGEHEHVAPRAWRLTEAAQAQSGPWSKGIIGQTLGEPVLAELRDNPINPETLDPHSRWVEHKIHRVVWRHAFTDHDCQATHCLAMMLAQSRELRDVVLEAYERGRRDASGAPWKPGEYDDV